MHQGISSGGSETRRLSKSEQVFLIIHGRFDIAPVNLSITCDSLSGLVHFTFTMPVRADAVFAGTPEPVATIDGVRYLVRGSSDLNGGSVPVEE